MYNCMPFKKNQRSEFFLKYKAKQNNMYTYYIHTDTNKKDKKKKKKRRRKRG